MVAHLFVFCIRDVSQLQGVKIIFQGLKYMFQGLKYIFQGLKRKFDNGEEKFYSFQKKCRNVFVTLILSKLLLFEKTSKNKKTFLFVWYFAHLFVPLQPILCVCVCAYT